MHKASETGFGKFPAITLAFWIIKIAATTLGETAGDAVSMTLHLGYAASSIVLFAIFAAVLTVQVRAREGHPFLYWAVIIATTTVGTTIADFADRSLGIGYVGGSLGLFAILLAVLGAWRLTLGRISVNTMETRTEEIFYWMTILFSNTLGTALGDFTADSSGLGFEGGALVFAALLAVIAGAYFFTRLSHTLLFWAAFVATRPLGATLGDLLTKPHASGGLDLGRIVSSLVITLFITASILLTLQRQAAWRRIERE